MGMDVDMVVARQYIENIEKLIINLPHGERVDACDDIIEFYEEMEKKYTKWGSKETGAGLH